MTREAKIGMLTGLGVIVLIGVLLSEYLGGAPHGPGMSATGRMATLPMGAAYRQEIMQPVGVPSLVRSEGAAGDTSGGGFSNQMLASAAPAAPAAPVAYAADAGTRMDAPISSGPAMNQPVTAVPAGTIQPDSQMASLPASVPTMQMPATGVQTVYVAGQPGSTSAAAPRTIGAVTLDGSATPGEAAAPTPVKPVGQEYVIASGDNLAKIAKKFYKSSKTSDIQRIVAANPAMLKNDKSVLLAGKKLLIPNVAPVADVSIPAPVAATVTPSRTVIRQPGTPAVGGDSATVTPAKKNAAGKTYVVQANDTLDKIARKLGGNVKDNVKKIMAANGIKDAKSLQVGQKLTLPSA